MWRLVPLILLAGCATVETRTVVACLPMREYSAEFQSAAADELERLPDGSNVSKMITDYGVMRAANRACRAGR